MSIQGTRQTMVPFFLVPCTVTRGLSILPQIVQADITHTSGSDQPHSGKLAVGAFGVPEACPQPSLLTPKDHFL